MEKSDNYKKQLNNDIEGIAFFVGLSTEDIVEMRRPRSHQEELEYAEFYLNNFIKPECRNARLMYIETWVCSLFDLTNRSLQGRRLEGNLWPSNTPPEYL